MYKVKIKKGTLITHNMQAFDWPNHSGSKRSIADTDQVFFARKQGLCWLLTADGYGAGTANSVVKGDYGCGAIGVHDKENLIFLDNEEEIIKIDKEIKSFKVLLENKIEEEILTEKMKRPEFLHGTTIKIKSGTSDHAMYVTINHIVLNEGTKYECNIPFEIFINTKDPEHAMWVMSLTRIISAIFRKGGNTEFLVKELKDVFDPKGGYFKKGTFMPSLVAEIGYAMETHFKYIGVIKDDEDNRK